MIKTGRGRKIKEVIEKKAIGVKGKKKEEVKRKMKKKRTKQGQEEKRKGDRNKGIRKN